MSGARAAGTAGPASSGTRRAITVRGFTLIELLVVVAIIAILGGLVLSGLFVAQESAREARTRSLISRLHNQLMDRWEGYGTRRLPVNLTDVNFDGLPTIANPSLAITPAMASANLKTLQRRQLWYRRQLQRRELPDRYTDLYFQPMFAPEVYPDPPYPANQGWPFTTTADSGTGAEPGPTLVGAQQRLRTSLFWAYHRQIVSVVGDFDINVPAAIETALEPIRAENQPAECLYLILTTGTTDESFGRNQFFESEVGDTDGDGMLEFIDAWGEPISFLRWAPGFSSLAQPQRTLRNTADPTDEFDQYLTASAFAQYDGLGRILTFDPQQNADPVDPLRLDPWPRDDGTAEERPERGYRLLPLIISPGRDRGLGIRMRVTLEGTFADDLQFAGHLDPYFDYDSSAALSRRGDRLSDDSVTPDNPETGSYSFDNIHNHDLGLP